MIFGDEYFVFEAILLLLGVHSATSGSATTDVLSLIKNPDYINLISSGGGSGELLPSWEEIAPRLICFRK